MQRDAFAVQRTAIWPGRSSGRRRGTCG